MAIKKLLIIIQCNFEDKLPSQSTEQKSEYIDMNRYSDYESPSIFDRFFSAILFFMEFIVVFIIGLLKLFFCGMVLCLAVWVIYLILLSF